MSRRKTGRSTTPVSSRSQTPAVHPDTLAFLRRSLQRNDVELTAVDKLNASLHDIKGKILQDGAGETILLQLGAGEIRIAQPLVTVGKDHKEMPVIATEEPTLPAKLDPTPSTEKLTPEIQTLCVDFLERMQLRRKLLNRLFRRLLRVAATMDTTETSTVEDPSKPPPVPRFGEDRFVINYKAAQACWDKVERQHAALEHKLDNNNDGTAVQAFLEYKTLYSRLRNPENNDQTIHYLANSADTPATWNGPKIAAAQRNLSAKEKEAEYQRWKDALYGRIPLQPTFADLAPTVFGYEARLDAARRAEQEKLEQGSHASSCKKEESAESQDDSEDEEGEKSESEEREEDESDAKAGYEEEEDAMEVDNEEKVEEKDKDEPAENKDGDSVKAADEEEKVEARKSSQDKKDEDMEVVANKEKDGGTEDKEAADGEKKDESEDTKEGMQQTTAKKDDNAMEVEKKEDEDQEMGDFGGDNDRTEKDESSDNEEDSAGEGDKKRASEGDSDSEEESDDDQGEKRSEEDKTDKDGEADGEGDDKKNDEKEKTHPVREKIVRPISLIPVPSFYEQDMKRIKVVHAELMSSSMQDFARRRTQEVVNDYNTALRKSNDLNERRTRLQAQLSSLMQDNRTFVSQVQHNYKAELEASYKQWNKRRQEFESARLNLYMPHRNNPHHRPNGTALTKVYSGQPDPTRRTVAFCLGDILDTAIAAGEGQFRMEKFTEEFRPPSSPDVQSNTNYAHNQRTEERLKKEYQQITTDLRNSEEERQKAWKRMMKTKAEFEMPHGRMSLDMNNYHMMPLPSLRQSPNDNVPGKPPVSLSLPMDASAVSRLPPVSSGHPQPMPSRPPNPSMPVGSTGLPGASDSKYSAARVKERISADGTVAPVTTPKRTKDGLYVRPAGRTRKGMEWDAVRGIWVPENPSNPQPPSSWG